ncbi:MAG: alpha/beta hydrolase [Verrucomicrobiales bacterium]|nr:alpha/beta hydrolase [Verrucomicrobiales bacterium]
MRIFSAALALLSLVCAEAQDTGKPTPRKLSAELVESLEIHPGLTYARYGERELQLDLYRPEKRGEALPAIICIHGGGWFKGDRGAMKNLAQTLAGRGYVTASISYRLSGEAKFPAAIQDAKAAVRWLRAEAETYGIDAAKIGVTGLSAGGHLAALLATSGGVEALEGEGGHPDESSAVQACVAMGAQSDLESARIRALSSEKKDPFYRTFLGDAQSVIPETYALASPRHHLDADDPAILFMAGQLDDPSTHADETREDLKRLGIPTGLMLLKDAPHAFLGRQEAFDECLKICDSFFSAHLKSGGGTSLAERFDDDFKAERFLTPIPNKNTQAVDGALRTSGASGGKYPPMVYLPVEGTDLEISFRYRHRGPGGMLWFFVDGEDGYGSIDHMLRVKFLRDGVQLQVDSHSLDPEDPLRQKSERPADKVSGAFRLNEMFPPEKVDLSGSEWREVLVTFRGEEVRISIDGDRWAKTLSRPNFHARKQKLLWMQNGGEKGIEIDDLVVRPSVKQAH